MCLAFLKYKQAFCTRRRLWVVLWRRGRDRQQRVMKQIALMSSISSVIHRNSLVGCDKKVLNGKTKHLERQMNRTLCVQAGYRQCRGVILPLFVAYTVAGQRGNQHPPKHVHSHIHTHITGVEVHDRVRMFEARTGSRISEVVGFSSSPSKLLHPPQIDTQSGLQAADQLAAALLAECVWVLYTKQRAPSNGHDFPTSSIYTQYNYSFPDNRCLHSRALYHLTYRRVQNKAFYHLGWLLLE